MDASPETLVRKDRLTFRIGLSFAAVGLVVLLSSCLIAVLSWVGIERFQPNMQMIGLTVIGGVVFVGAGFIVMIIGSMGTLGAGVDMEPEDEVRRFDAMRERYTPATGELVLFCVSCRSANEQRARFCNQCGSSLESSPDAVKPAPTTSA